MSADPTMRAPKGAHAPYLASMLALSACGGAHLPVTPPEPHAEEGFSTPQATHRPGLPTDTPRALQLQPGDTISVEVISTTTQTYAGLVLDGTGVVHLPLVGDVKVGQLGLTEVETVLAQKLQRFDKLVQVHVQATSYGGQRATVLGAVNGQGSIQLIPGARIADVVALAGGAVSIGGTPSGATVPADLDGAVVQRDGKALPIDFRRALQGERLHNVHVHPGDTIYVPPARGMNISVLGQVGAPTVFPWREGMRLTEALAVAGGVTTGGDKNDVRVIRGTLVQPRVYRSSLAELVAGDTHNVVLRPGDVIFVSDHWIEDVTEVVGVVSPLLSTALTATTAAILLQQ